LNFDCEIKQKSFLTSGTKKRGNKLDEETNRKIRILSKKQDEIIIKMNVIIERLNAIPKNINDEKKLLEKKTLYLEEEIEKLKYKRNFSDKKINLSDYNI